MDPSKLTDRLRAIVGAGSVRLKPDPTPELSKADVVSGVGRTVGNLEPVLGGQWRRRNGLSCFIVERHCDPATSYGREPLKTLATRLADSWAEAALVSGGAPARPPFVFFDLETTGLSGGAGTYAFLVGCGSFDEEGGFLTRQFVLVRHGDERQLLQMVGTELAQAGALVSFNGKSFDAPLIETRYLFHRLQWQGSRLPHLDLLHPARRFWSEGGDTPCSLGALEGLVLGVSRTGDVPGSEIPARYFQFIRSGDARPLAAVLEHNRLDLLSLAGLTARLLDLVRVGPGAARHAREALALGRVYARCRLDGRAREAYQRARTDASIACTGASMAGNDVSIACTGASMACTDASMASIRMDAVRALALLSRRARRYEDAAAYWRELLEGPACPPHHIREASEALAVHHEHRAHNLPAARAFALRTFDARRPARNQAVQHRLARIEKKMELTARRTLFPS